MSETEADYCCGDYFKQQQNINVVEQGKMGNKARPADQSDNEKGGRNCHIQWNTRNAAQKRHKKQTAANTKHSRNKSDGGSAGNGHGEGS